MTADDHSDNLIFLTNRVGRQLARLAMERITFDKFEAQGPHIGLLADLSAQSPQRQQDLAITTVKDKATITRAVQQMENAGLITRVPDTIDRRQKMISITKQGRKFWQHAQEEMQTVLEKATESIDPEKLAICNEVLFSIYEAQREVTLYAKQSTHE
ncbi:MarR family winged helix-turn-helix transcriptional regulator [Lewinella sp. 4G2]|uniref:MarR family winged helix-turn-helix transcriptional regulator n=1 Tax=Lewinella sp. 4G2 TaxID=1803372 RepID=UPI0018D277E6|nr:MarR family transcriptional regulator [Lewinella sp. 4G2]